MAAMLLALAAVAMATPAQAEVLPETNSIDLVADKPVPLPIGTKTTRSASARITFWVGKDGDVEAVELACGERALFDDIVDELLEWRFKGRNFSTELSFVRRGRRAVLLYRIPAARRPRKEVCPQESA